MVALQDVCTERSMVLILKKKEITTEYILNVLESGIFQPDIKQKSNISESLLTSSSSLSSQLNESDFYFLQRERTGYYNPDFVNQLFQEIASFNYNEITLILDKLQRGIKLHKDELSILGNYPFLLKFQPKDALNRLQKAKQRLSQIEKINIQPKNDIGGKVTIDVTHQTIFGEVNVCYVGDEDLFARVHVHGDLKGKVTVMIPASGDLDSKLTVVIPSGQNLSGKVNIKPYSDLLAKVRIPTTIDLGVRVDVDEDVPDDVVIQCNIPNETWQENNHAQFSWATPNDDFYPVKNDIRFFL